MLGTNSCACTSRGFVAVQGIERGILAFRDCAASSASANGASSKPGDDHILDGADDRDLLSTVVPWKTGALVCTRDIGYRCP